MAKNGNVGDGHRNGMVRERSQAYNPKTGTCLKRYTETVHFLFLKNDGTPFKGVRKEHSETDDE